LAVVPPAVLRLLAAPQQPTANDPAALSLLGSPGTPEDDLRNALDALAGAADTATASSALQQALDILEGNPLPTKAYSGIPLLNWNVAAKVKTVPAGGTVTVNQVRFGERILTDTWLLRFN